MRKAALILWIFFFSIGQGMAQESITISGVVQDSTGTVLPSATVMLLSARDSLHTLTRSDGQFQISLHQPKSLELIVTMKGYVPYKKKINFNAKAPSLRLKPIILQTDYLNLDPVIVTGIRPVIITQDTVTYNARAYSVRDGSEVESLLKRLPGIEVDQEGNVIVQGKKVGKLLVDGKLFFGGDVLMAIRNLPAEIVEKLQVIDDYGDKARFTGIKSGEPSKVLNIVLKKDKRNGQFGHIDAGMGNAGKYSSAAFANAFSGERQLGINTAVRNNSATGLNIQKGGSFSYADRWGTRWKGEGLVSLIGSDVRSSGGLTQDDYFSGGQTHQEQSTKASGASKGANLAGTFTYTPGESQMLRVSPTINMQHSHQSTAADVSAIQQSGGVTKTSNGHSNLDNRTDNFSAGADIYFEQISRSSKNRFTAQLKANYSIDKLIDDNHLFTTTELYNTRNDTEQHYLTNNIKPAWNLGADLNYYSPAGKTGFLEFGYNWHESLSDSRKSVFQLDSLHPAPTLIDSLSQYYFYHTTDHRLHGGYTGRVQGVNLTIGLDMQSSKFNGNTSSYGKNIQYQYLNLLPSIQASYNLSRSRVLRLMYSGSPSLPGLQQVQPVTDITNPQYPVVGNPALRPAYSHGINLHYEQSSLQAKQYWGFGVGAGYSLTENAIIQDIVHPKDSGNVIQLTTFLNAGKSQALNASYNISLPAFIQNKMRIILNGQLTRSQSLSMADDVLYTISSLTGTQNLHMQFIIPDRMELDLSGNYSYTRSRYPNANGIPIAFTSADWSLNNRHYLWRHWILNYQLSQSYTGANGQRMQANPSMMTAALQRQFLHKNKATISIIGYDLFNTSSGVSQFFSPTNVTRSQAKLTGRYFIIQFFLNWNKFKE